VLIIELRKSFERISEDVIGEFRLELRGVDFEEGDGWLDRLSASVEVFVKNSLNGIEAIKTKLEGKEGRVYQLITSLLAITTNILNPVIEVVLVLLPDIVSKVFKSKQEEMARAKIKEAFHNQLIPKIRLNLQRVLPEIVNKETQNIINAVSEKFEREIESKKMEIEEVLKEKEEQIDEIEKKIKELEIKKEEIKKLKKLLKEEL
jgi:predicted PurR-regulated permease PerM